MSGPGLQGTYAGSCVVCLKGTDTAVLLVGEDPLFGELPGPPAQRFTCHLRAGETASQSLENAEIRAIHVKFQQLKFMLDYYLWLYYTDITALSLSYRQAELARSSRADTSDAVNPQAPSSGAFSIPGD